MSSKTSDQPRIYVIGPKDVVPENTEVIDTTSKSKDIGRFFSPFVLGPVTVYPLRDKAFKAQNVENGWQFSKVYEQHADPVTLEPTEEWLQWAQKGFSDTFAHRYPMGKGAKPLYSLYFGAHLDYIEARKNIYSMLYIEAAKNSPEITSLIKKVLQILNSGKNLAFFDFDGYNADALGMDFNNILLDKERKMGHAFLLRELVQQTIIHLHQLNSAKLQEGRAINNGQQG